VAVSASCPAGGTRSSRVHSRYCRVLRDLAWQGTVVHVYLWTRRFYCPVGSCECRVFTQRLPQVVKPYARETNRHRDAVLVIGYALGGEAGRRLALQLGVSVSADTILRVLRQCDAEAIEDVKVLGVGGSPIWRDWRRTPRRQKNWRGSITSSRDSCVPEQILETAPLFFGEGEHHSIGATPELNTRAPSWLDGPGRRGEVKAIPGLSRLETAQHGLELLNFGVWSDGVSHAAAVHRDLEFEFAVAVRRCRNLERPSGRERGHLSVQC
jgi:hypothetical protein